MLDSEIEFKYFFKTTLVPSQTSEANVELLLQWYTSDSQVRISEIYKYLAKELASTIS